jgi:uncharacterized protein YlxW (UPF0749 family)
MNTLAQQFATDYARGVVPQMLDAINRVRRSSAWIARGALAVTTPHQVLYIGSLGHGGSLVDAITAWCFAILIPAITDLGMLTMLRITQTPGMHEQARRRALLVLALLVAESATVNALAPGATVFRVLVAFAAVVLALVEWVHAAVRPDFAAIEVHEQAAAPASVIDEAAEARKADRRERDRARRAVKREAELLAARAAAERKAATAERRRIGRQVKAAELAALETSFAAASAPVSPAPGEAAAYL